MWSLDLRGLAEALFMASVSLGLASLVGGSTGLVVLALGVLASLTRLAGSVHGSEG